MLNIKKILVAQPTKLIGTVLLAIICNSFFSLAMKSFFFSLSLSIKEILMLMIPFVIYSSIFFAFRKLVSGAALFVVLLLSAVVLSNFVGFLIGGTLGYGILERSSDFIMAGTPHSADLVPLWTLSLPTLIANNKALAIAFVLAFLTRDSEKNPVVTISRKIHKSTDLFLRKFFVPLLPVFIFGFVLKIFNDDVGKQVLVHNIAPLAAIILSIFGYLFILYTAATVLLKKRPLAILKNIAAPAITAFCTMSSAAALPFSIKAAERNTNKKEIADAVIPMTVTIHMIGDAICIPALAFLLLGIFHIPAPDLSGFLVFAFFFVMMKFSGAGIPGGSILIMIPVLENHLGFTAEMSGLITIIYMLLDPVATCGNVVGNNIFVILFSKLYSALKPKLEKEVSEEEEVLGLQASPI